MEILNNMRDFWLGVIVMDIIWLIALAILPFLKAKK